jgi:hypothetical protein
MTWLNILYLVLSAVIGIVATLIPFIVKVNKSVKAFKDAKTDVEREKANAELLDMAKHFVNTAEVAFEGFDKLMKAQNGSAGAMKKDTVLSKLQVYALQNGYEFDAVYWSEKIDELVKFTKDVNGK